MALASQLAAARSVSAAQARTAAIDSARNTAENAKDAAEERLRLERKWYRTRLETEKDAATARALRERQMATRARDGRVREPTTVGVRGEDYERREGDKNRAGRKEGGSEPDATAPGNHHGEVPTCAGKSHSRAQTEFAARRAAAEARADAQYRAFVADAARRTAEPFGRRSLPRAAYTGSQSQVRGFPARTMEAVMPAGELEGLDALTTRALALHALRHEGCPHRCLGLAPNAQALTVRKRYLELARRLHPNKTEHPLASQAFAAVEAAFREMQPEPFKS